MKVDKNQAPVPGMPSAADDNRAMMKRLLRVHYAWQHGTFVTATEEMPGGLAAYSSVTPIPMWNHGAWIEGTEQEFASFLSGNASWQAGKKRRPVVYVSGPSDDQLLAMQKAGYEKFDEEAWMIHRGGVPRKSADAAPVDDESALNDLVGTFYAAFQIKQEGYEQALRKRDAKARHFVLYRHGSPVSCGTLVAEGTMGCIYNLGTPAARRGQGFGGELLEHLVAVAREGGCDTVFLQVENQSGAKRLYERHGFETAFVRLGFRQRDWQAESPVRTKLSAVLSVRSAPESERALYARETRPLTSPLRSAAGESIEAYCAGAWAYVLHRYTGDEVSAFSIRRNGHEERLEFRIDRAAPSARWIKLGRAETTRSEAEETVLCFGAASPSHLQQPSAPLELHISGDQPDSIEFVFRTGIFSKEAIRRLAAHYVTALESIIADPNARVEQIEILPPFERHQLFVEWNRPQFPLIDRRIHQLFEAQVESTPEATALMFAQAGVAGPAAQMTYRQLNRRANRLAHRLQSLGVGPDVFVGVCLERSLEMIVSLLAIFKAGGACVPLDPAYPIERLAFILQDTAAPVLLTQNSLAKNFPGLTAKVIKLDDPWPRELAEAERNLVSTVSSEHAAYVIYTSGSTGQPKGVVIPHHAIANHSLDCRKTYGLNPRDRILQFSSFNFDASFEQILPALISGAALVVRDAEVWSTREFERKLADFQLTVADIPTAYWHQLADEWHKAGSVPSNHLRLVIVGGEALSPEKLALWQQTAMNRVRLINAYGPTETTITATSYEVPPRQNGEAVPAALPIGRPRGDRKAYVLDQFGTPVPIGVPGELHLGGTMLARGYHNRFDLTVSRFISNPFSDEPDARLYKTGDLVRYLEDGTLEFLGRIDDQVKIRGFRIELGEVESSLRAHPAVRDAVVLAKASSSGEKRLVAYATSNGRPLSEKDLRAHVRARLPEYMVPGAIMVLDRFPLMPSGKIDRRALPEPPEEIAAEGEVHGPRDPLELQIKLLFERVLKRVPIGIDVSFFELGGDSLQALELLVDIERATGKQLPLGTLYQSSTVEALARELRQRSGQEEWSCLVPLQASGKRPPLFLLHTTPGDILGYGNLVYRLGPDQPCFGLQSLGLHDPAECHETVEEMAAYYVTLLRESHPHGPYYLGGWCYGGVVAVEMARLLKAQGEEIALLALLETVALPPKLTNWRYFAHRFMCGLKMGPRRWFTYFREKARYVRESRVANRMRFRQVESVSPAEETGEPRARRLARLEQVYNTNLKALEDYNSRYYDGKVVLFNAAEKDPAIIADPQYGWVGLAREIEIHEVPGDHDTMLTEPNVSVLARRLSECLSRAQQFSSGTNK